MSVFEDVLQRIGLKYEDLTMAEKDTLLGWMDSLKKSQVNLESVRKYLSSMRDAVEDELTKTGHNSKQDLFLKARLRNYLLLEAFLSSPEKAEEALNRAISGLVPTAKVRQAEEGGVHAKSTREEAKKTGK
jgi:hypothetical protein